MRKDANIHTYCQHNGINEFTILFGPYVCDRCYRAIFAYVMNGWRKMDRAKH